jgi:hypothetical protein
MPKKQIPDTPGATVKILQFKGSEWIKIDDLVIVLNEAEEAFKSKSDLHNLISALLKLKN